MAECSYSRCIQQKRYIRRELQRWTKNMVYIVGLERIAEELMGRRKWKLYQESMSRNYLQPINNNVEKITGTDDDDDDEFLKNYRHHQRDFSDSNIKQFQKVLLEQKRVKEEIAKEEEERLKDWMPEEKCYFCVDGKLDSENNIALGALSPQQTDSDSSDSHSDLEAPPTLTPPTPGSTLNNHANMTTIESVTSMAALASAVAAFSGNPPTTPTTPSLSCYNPYLLPPNWYLANVARSFQNERLLENIVEKTGNSEQPLDLSSKSTNCGGSPVENKISLNLRLPTLDSKQIFKAKPRMSAIAGRRTYTEDELQAALRDIQSGKLGTRRAAVIYGIPRSTLRNKVYKLAMERERESHLTSTTPIKIEEEEPMDDDKELSGAEEEKEVEKALQAPLLSMADILRFSNIDNQEALKNIFHQEHSAVGPYIQNILMHPSGGGIITRNHHQQYNGERSPSNSVVIKLERSESSDMETEESPSNVILKIPSFKPTTSSTSSRNGSDFYRSPTDSSLAIISPHSESDSPPILPGRGMTLKDVKDVIAKSISQKFQQTPEPLRMPSLMEMDYKRNDFTPPIGSMMKNSPYMTHSPKLPHTPTTTVGGKGTRPKRGKYRNYDRDSLVEAVRAVQRGEMSVHRAGSYYGVPHSTLEYKVKERHLMRPRKRDPKPNPVDEKLASLKQNDLRLGDKIIKPLMKPPQPKFPPTSPNGMKMPLFDPNVAQALGYNPPPFPFWPHPGFPHIPLDYGRSPPTTSTFPPNAEHFFASQMMHKLQEELARTQHGNSPIAPLPKNARQIAESLLDGAGPNGSFLDGIIRSSLESGVPLGSGDNKPNDERNITPENMSNKALLDQLCRNSRLTPLPIPESTSSGDENVHTIDLSNDSTCSGRYDERKLTPPRRIYIKQDLVNPDNLNPDLLMRFRGDIETSRNGGIEGSASESDVAQD